MVCAHKAQHIYNSLAGAIVVLLRACAGRNVHDALNIMQRDNCLTIRYGADDDLRAMLLPGLVFQERERTQLDKQRNSGSPHQVKLHNSPKKLTPRYQKHTSVARECT